MRALKVFSGIVLLFAALLWFSELRLDHANQAWLAAHPNISPDSPAGSVLERLKHKDVVAHQRNLFIGTELLFLCALLGIGFVLKLIFRAMGVEAPAAKATVVTIVGFFALYCVLIVWAERGGQLL